MGILRDLFGPGTWGAGGNLVAWVLCGALAGVWARAKLAAHHQALAAQAERHHAERQSLAIAHHNELKHLSEKHHQQSLARLEDHAEALKAHVTASLRPPAARRGAKSPEGAL